MYKYLFSCYLQKYSQSVSESIDAFDQYKYVDIDEERIFEFHMSNACISGCLESIKEYLQSHDVNDFLCNGWTPLLYTASCSQAEVIEYLIKNGADVNKHKDGYTPLMALCSTTRGTIEDRMQCLTLLIKEKANVNATSKQRQTPLMYACTSQEPEFVMELLKYVKNINAYDSRNQTALIYATIANKLDIVKILIEKGADTTLTDNSNLTAKDIALMKGFDKILPLLNFNEEEIVTISKTSKICDWMDMFSSLNSINDQTIDFDVFTILHGMGLEKYTHNFKGMSLKNFLKLTENDLYNLGVEIKAHRIQFMEHLHKFHRKRWSRQSIGAIDKTLSYTIYNGVVSLGTVSKQIAIIGSSFQYIKNNLLKANNENIHLSSEQISNYKEELKKTQTTLGILKKELLQVYELSKKVKKENDIGIPATYIGPKKCDSKWLLLLSIMTITGMYLFRTVYMPRLINN
ncbi:Ankyrin repeat, SAM and basic leucine zipper domain-containing protein 1 [Dufourea novaeangliae]|uniref:Ankyrin repeat, SAM and basic leucine zipper domain-containing protein 1 n=1 Tax=Dufourea novaeangliae TaxID=178035 RepID=A0A154NW71_DUFNO|nr:Ankyrin repeat, SAM and basic leucine zipper domain-containing protein 1 [Dufourea novaeangliae]